MALGGFIEFKGTKEGIVIQFLEHAELGRILDELRVKLSKSGSFFKGAEVIGTEGARLEDEEREYLKRFIENEFGITVRSLEQYRKKNFVKVESADRIGEPQIHSGVFEGLEEGVTKFVKGTLRSGRSVFFDGNLVIMGDVNPGAEVVAFGNIVIMGTLRGVAHAGANGNEGAFVAANKLRPTQLRIASMITRAPDGSEYDSDTPEIAYIKESNIVIEPYL